jgi:flagellar assembly factor FliW
MNAPARKPEPSTEILFEEGIIGVPRARRFQLLEREGSPILVLQCLDIEGFALPVVEPRRADPDYAPAIGPRVAEALDLARDDPVVVMAIATLEENGPRANLRAPVIINVRNQLAAQVILEDRSYPLRAAVTMEEQEDGA